jgi:hypothetical protein
MRRDGYNPVAPAPLCGERRENPAKSWRA